MKTLILLGALAIIGTTTLSAQDKIQDRDQDRVMLVDGDVLQIRTKFDSRTK